MKLGIVGAGMIAQEVLQVLKEIPAIQVLGIVTRESSYEKLAPIAAAHHIPHTYQTYAQLLANPDIDTIYIANYNNLHFEFAVQAITAGKHVIIEKPIVLHASQVADIHQLAKTHQVIVLEAVNLLHLPSYHKIKELLPLLGDVKVVSCNYSQYSSRYLRFLAGEILPAFDVSMGGGALMDINVYNLNFIIGLFGAPVSASYAPNLAEEVDTSGIMSMTYDSFQATAIGAKDANGPNICVIQGNKGYIEMSAPISVMEKVTLHLNGQEPVVYQLNEGKHRLYHEFVAFADIIEKADYERAYQLQVISQQVMDVIERSRA